MPTPPTRISVTETADWITAGASRSIASLSWQIGDVLVAVCIGEGATTSTLGVPTNTGSGLSWASYQNHAATSDCAARISACVASAASSGVISVTNSSATDHWGFAVYIYRDSDGIGNSVEQDTTTQTVALTPTAANGSIVWGVGDWSAEAAHTGTPTPTNTVEATADAGRYTAHVFDLTNQTSAGAVSYGVTGGGTTGPYTIVALEVKGIAATVPSEPELRRSGLAIQQRMS